MNYDEENWFWKMEDVFLVFLLMRKSFQTEEKKVNSLLEVFGKFLVIFSTPNYLYLEN